MNNTRSQIILTLFAWVPYVLVSWGYAKLLDGSFWSALGALVAVRLFFGAIETLGSVLAWRLYGKKKMIERNLSILRTNNFPEGQPYENFSTYVNRIQNDDTCSQQIKIAASQWYQVLLFFEDSGVLLGMRMNAAADEALKIYSPKMFR